MKKITKCMLTVEMKPPVPATAATPLRSSV